MPSDVTRNELELAFAHYCDVRERAIATGELDIRHIDDAYRRLCAHQELEEPAVLERVSPADPGDDLATLRGDSAPELFVVRDENRVLVVAELVSHPSGA